MFIARSLLGAAAVAVMLAAHRAGAATPVEATVAEILGKYDTGDGTTQEIVREILMDTENGVFWASIIAARDAKTKPMYCRPLDNSVDGYKLIDLLRLGAKSPDFAGAPYGAGVTLVLKRLYPCK